MRATGSESLAEAKGDECAEQQADRKDVHRERVVSEAPLIECQQSDRAVDRSEPEHPRALGAGKAERLDDSRHGSEAVSKDGQRNRRRSISR